MTEDFLRQHLFFSAPPSPSPQPSPARGEGDDLMNERRACLPDLHPHRRAWVLTGRARILPGNATLRPAKHQNVPKEHPNGTLGIQPRDTRNTTHPQTVGIPHPAGARRGAPLQTSPGETNPNARRKPTPRHCRINPESGIVNFRRNTPHEFLSPVS
jgi:hypothetical protein